MRFTIINFTDPEKIKNVIDNLLIITRKKPLIVNHEEKSIPNCDLIILPDEFRTSSNKVITEKILNYPVIKELKNHIARGGSVLGINSGAEILINANLIDAKIKRFNNNSDTIRRVVVEIKKNSNSPFLKMYGEKEILNLDSYSSKDCFILESKNSNLKNKSQIAFKYRNNNIHREPNKIDAENTGIAGIVSENGKILCSIPDPTIFNQYNVKGNDPKLFFEKVVKILS